MRKILILALVLVVAAGCKKAKNTDSGGGGGVALAPPSPGGTVQAVRMAGVRTIVLNDLQQLRTLIEAAATEKGSMPNAQEITASLGPDGRKLRQMIEEKYIILTGTSKRDSIWAYTAHPHTPAGEHLYASGTAVERISRADLDQRLKKQGLPGL